MNVKTKIYNRHWVYLGLGTVLSLLSACAHTSHTRGSVVILHSDSEADVCLGDDEVKTGDSLAFYDSVCEPLRTEGKGQKVMSCKKVQTGTGKVLRTLNEHYSTVSLQPGTKVKEGTIVEKQ